MSGRVPKVPSYRLHKPTGQAVVRLNRRDHYLGKFGSDASKTEYSRLIAEWLSTGQQVLAPSAPTNGAKLNGQDDLLIKDLILTYWNHVESYYVKNGNPTTEVDIIRQALRPFRKLYEHTSVKDFGPLALKAVRNQMIESGQSRKVINQYIGRIKRMFRWATENELVPPQIFHGLQAVEGLKAGRTKAREAAPIMPAPIESVNAVLPHVSPHVAAMIQLQLLTGARPGEVIAMRPCDVTMTTDGVWIYRPESHKTQHFGRERKIFIGPKAQEILRPWLKRDAQSPCFSPVEAEATRNGNRRKNRKSPMTPSQAKRKPKRNRARPPGRSYTINSYRAAVQRGCKDAGVPKWSPNQLRHTSATDIRKRYGLEGSQVVLGHNDPMVTTIYAERDFELAAKIMREIG